MNQETYVPQETPAKTVKRNCPKCGWIRDTADTKCPDCGKLLQSVAKIRGIGVFLVILGTGLLGIMGWLSLWMYNAMTATGGSGATFNGGPKDMGLIIFVFALVVLISVV